MKSDRNVDGCSKHLLKTYQRDLLKQFASTLFGAFLVGDEGVQWATVDYTNCQFYLNCTLFT